MTDLNPMRSGNQHTAASGASTTSKATSTNEPPEWVHRYLRLSPRLRRGYRRFVGTLPDGPKRLQDLDEEISQWPADIEDADG